MDYKKRIVSHSTFEKDIEVLYNRIKKVGKYYHYIYGFPRGGSVIAVYLSHLLGLEYLSSPSNKDFLHAFGSLLIVDDIADTGRTLKTLLGKKYRFDIATLYYKPRSTIRPTYWAKEVPNNTWIVFPWESKEEKPNR